MYLLGRPPFLALRVSVLICSAAIAAAGCGPSPGSPAPDAGGDASSSDGGAPDAADPRDAGRHELDDAGSDAGADAGREPCEVPGAFESVACGSRCGTVTRFCTAEHVWAYGECGEEGLCQPGTIADVACERCGTRSAHCTTECVYDESGECTGQGECEAGTTTRTDVGCPSGQTRPLICGDACTYTMGACEIDDCEPGSHEIVECGMCGTRVRTCSAARQWEEGACEGEGVCAPDSTSSGSCGNCGTQPLRCDATCAWQPSGGCTDEGECAPDSSAFCVTECGSFGSYRCDASCAWSACDPPGESCNGVDDDCDDVIDDGCAGCPACEGSIAVSGEGGRYEVPLVPGARTGSCGGAGSEGLLHVTITAPSDVFVTTHGAALDTVLHVHECDCSGPELACNDDADGATTSVLRLSDVPAGTYTIVVDTESELSGSVAVDVYVTPSDTAGDRCGNPRPLTLEGGAGSVTGDTCSAGAEYDLAFGTLCDVGAAADAPEQVFYFYLPTASTVTFDGCGPGFGYDGTLYVRSECGNAAPIAQEGCDDDGCEGGVGPCIGLGYGPRLTVPLAAGMHYLFVDGYGLGGAPGTCGGCGPFQIDVSTL